MAIGVVIGLLAGYLGGRTDTVLSLGMDLMLAFPSLLLAIVIVAALGPGLRNTALAIGISSVPIFARVVRGSTISVGRNEYIEAARAMGSRPPRIMFRHVLPNILAPITVIATIQLARAILYEASLSFLGLGAQPPTPSWGAMAAAGRRFLQSDPHIVLVPSAAIMVTVLAFNLFGDGLRDALDPRLRTSD
jgi:peptide/nickel transport system permease protein